METYTHKVQYYETDRMGITHHTNYIRWMEEARLDFMEKTGWSYQKMEEIGILSPVLAVDCKYKNSTTFYDEVVIEVGIKAFKGVRLIMEYSMRKKGEDTLVLTGTTEHCFMDREYRPMRLEKKFPELYHTIMELLATQERKVPLLPE